MRRLVIALVLVVAPVVTTAAPASAWGRSIPVTNTPTRRAVRPWQWNRPVPCSVRAILRQPECSDTVTRPAPRPWGRR